MLGRMFMIVLFSISLHACYIGSKIVVSLYALQLGASQFTIGILAALYATVPLLLAIYAGKLTDTRGTRWPLFGGSLVMMLGMLTSYLWPGMAAMFVTAILAGAAFVFFNVAVQTLTGGLGNVEARARNFSLLSIGYSISTFIGPVSAGVAIDHLGHTHAFLMLAGFTLLPITGLLLGKGYNFVGGRKNEPGRSALDLLRLPPLRAIVIVSGLLVAAWDLFAFYLPVYAHSLRFSATTIGLIMGVFAVAAFVTRFTIPYLLKRWRSERVMFACILLAAAAFAVLPMHTSLFFMLPVVFCLGLGLGCGQPLSMMLAFNRSPAGREGEVTGLRLTANNVARVAIPVLVGALGSTLGAAPVFWLSALNLSAISVLVWKL